jgi:hypothetical protein
VLSPEKISGRRQHKFALRASRAMQGSSGAPTFHQGRGYWTKSTDDILASIERFSQRTLEVHAQSG